MTLRTKLHPILTALSLSLLVLNPVWADDTEIFFSTSDSEDLQANILFVLDGSGSMDWYDCENLQTWQDQNGNIFTNHINYYGPCPNETTTSATTTRMNRMKAALREVLNTTSNINVGLMRFSHQFGGRILYPVRQIDEQICYGEPCDEETVFEEVSRPLSSDDDATEAQDGTVIVTDQSLPLMSNDAGVGQHSTAIRFPELDIPQGATIVEAHLVATAAQTNADPATLNIAFEDSSDAAPFTTAFNSIRTRDTLYNTMPWTDVPAWESGEEVTSPDLAILLQQITNKNDWCGGNAATVRIQGTGNRKIQAFEQDPSFAPSLRVKYTLESIPADGGCTTARQDPQLDTNIDDATQEIGDWGTVYRTYHTLVVNGPYMSGMSFSKKTNIPQGAKIKSATLRVKTQEPAQNWWSSNDIQINLSVESNGNPLAFGSNNGNLTTRPKSAPQLWEPNPLALDNFYSVDVTDLIQSVVDQGNWSPGNRINMFMEKTSTTNDASRGFISKDDTNSSSSTDAPMLQVVFETKITRASDLIDGPVTNVRKQILQHIDDLKPAGGTPTVAAMLEARAYFAGEAVKHGKRRADPDDTNHLSPHYSRVSHPQSYTDGYLDPACDESNPYDENCADEEIKGAPVYISPVQHQCQPHHIVVLTDGEPSEDTVAVTDTQLLTGGACTDTGNAQGGGQCGADLAYHLANTDFTDKFTQNQFLKVHSIGLNFSTPWLQGLAEKGGGGFYTANSTQDLVAAFSSILKAAADVDTTFVAPGAAVDQFTRLSHRKDIYLALFKPSSSPVWGGNLKKFHLSGKPPRLVDANGNDAVDIATGQFVDGSLSYWSAEVDGNNTVVGGAASKLDKGNRVLVSNLSNNADLTNASNALSDNNDLLTTTMLGTDSEGRDKMVAWLQGVDVLDEDNDQDTNDARNHFGDPLHSRPALVNYGGTSKDPDAVVFVGTNEGFLHAIDINDGTELFAYMPKELISNVKSLYDNNVVDGKPYGVDGPITVRTQDNNKNGILETGDKAHLVFGMRRGGRSYHALDVTVRDKPELLWTIQGGIGKFKELGQSWSKPILGNILIGDTKETVYIFGGGYDETQDDKTVRTADGMGRAIYIVRAEDGELLWSGTPDTDATQQFPDMAYSIPSDITVVKNDKNLVTQMYVGDTGGRVWRFDVHNGKPADDLIEGGIVANLSSDNDASETRRFYHPPDLSTSRVRNKLTMNISIGSGYQAHPLDKTIEDKFFIIRVPYKYSGNYGIEDEYGDYVPIAIDEDNPDDSDLYNATENLIGEGTPDEQNTEREKLLEKHGWYITMERAGEKVLGKSATLDNVVKFISYIPGAGQLDNCEPDIGRSSYWAVNLLDGTPHYPDANGIAGSNEEDLDKSDRNRDMPGAGIAPPVQTLFVEENGTITPTDISGTNVLSQGTPSDTIERWYWSEVQ